MSDLNTFNETVHQVPLPTRFYRLVVDPNGFFLTVNEDGKFELTKDGNDSILWNEDTSDEYRHVNTGRTIKVRDTAGPDRSNIDVDDQDLVAYTSESNLSGNYIVKHGPAQRPSTYLEKLQSNGWVCLTQILPDDLVERLEKSASTDRFEDEEFDWNRCRFDNNAALVEVAAEPISLWLLREYMETEDVRLSHTPAFVRLKQDDGKRNVQGWHSDYPYHWGTGHTGSIPHGTGRARLGVQRNVCVSPFSRERGATAFKLGSHARDDGPPETWGIARDHARRGYRADNGLPYGGPDADIIEAPGGSIILYDSRTWHRQGVNRTARIRAAILQAMTPSYVFPKNDTLESYKQLTSSSIYDGLNERVKLEIQALMVHQFLGPGGRYAVAPDKEFSKTLPAASVQAY